MLSGCPGRFKLSGEQLQLPQQHLGQGPEQGFASTGLLQAPLQGVEVLPVLMQGLQPLLFPVAGRAKAVQAALPGVIAEAAALAQAVQRRLGGGGEAVAIDHRQPTHAHQLFNAFPCGGTPQLACLLLQQAAVQPWTRAALQQGQHRMVVFAAQIQAVAQIIQFHQGTRLRQPPCLKHVAHHVAVDASCVVIADGRDGLHQGEHLLRLEGFQGAPVEGLLQTRHGLQLTPQAGAAVFAAVGALGA